MEAASNGGGPAARRDADDLKSREWPSVPSLLPFIDDQSAIEAIRDKITISLPHFARCSCPERPVELRHDRTG